MATPHLEALQRRYGAELEARIAWWLDRSSALPAFSGMMRYQLGYVDACFRTQQVYGGKRFRPLLFLAACGAFGGRTEDALDLAVAIELLHNFSLIHDDIEDGDRLRRDRETVWAVWGQPQAINAGDGMFALAVLASLHAAGAAGTPDIATAFMEASLLLTEGQYLDMSFEARSDVTEEEYLAMIARKSAAIVRFATASGARVAAQGDAVIEAMGRFGHELGMAFQLRDDVQGIWASARETGKQEMGDLANHKKTLPVLRAAARANAGAAAVVEAYLRGEKAAPAEVRQVLDRLGIRQEMEGECRARLDAALAALNEAGLAGESYGEIAGVAMELAGQAPATS